MPCETSGLSRRVRREGWGVCRFFLLKTQELEENKSQEAQGHVVVQASPGTALKMVKSKLLFELLIALLDGKALVCNAQQRGGVFLKLV